MAMSINTNAVSINAQRNLGLSGSSLGVSMQRLSSGLRVNSAKDDAAGLAIAERMTTQVKGLEVASRNANDGISLAQTAEGALGKVGDMLQRMRELAVQAGNATNSKSDRQALQAELAQLREEVDRVAKTTSFNGAKLLDGGFTGAVFQVGANAGDNITVGALANTKVAELGKSLYTTSESEAVDDDLKADLAAAIADEDEDGRTITITVAFSDASGRADLEIGVTLRQDMNVTEDEALGQVLNAINSKTADTGAIAYLGENEDGEQVIQLRVLANDGDTEEDFTTVTIAGLIEIEESAALEEVDDVSAYKGFANISIETQAGAWEAMQHINAALDKVNQARGELGAIQARFEKSIENIDIQNENLSTARGRILDADFAKETANLSRTQILQQAGTAMVAQANQLPQQVLSLLR